MDAKDATDLVVLQQRLEYERSIEDVIVCTIEEMSELTKVLTKYLRHSRKFNLDDLHEEVAHVLLMVDTTKDMFGLDLHKIKEEQLKALRKCFDKPDCGEISL